MYQMQTVQCIVNDTHFFMDALVNRCNLLIYSDLQAWHLLW